MLPCGRRDGACREEQWCKSAPRSKSSCSGPQLCVHGSSTPAAGDCCSATPAEPSCAAQQQQLVGPCPNCSASVSPQLPALRPHVIWDETSFQASKQPHLQRQHVVVVELVVGGAVALQVSILDRAVPAVREGRGRAGGAMLAEEELACAPRRGCSAPLQRHPNKDAAVWPPHMSAAGCSAECAGCAHPMALLHSSSSSSLMSGLRAVQGREGGGTYQADCCRQPPGSLP